MGTLEPVTVVADPLDPVSETRPCEACGFPVRLLIYRCPPGYPDLIRVVFPEHAWLGWNVAPPAPSAEIAVRILVLCSRACAVEWFDLRGPSV